MKGLLGLYLVSLAVALASFGLSVSSLIDLNWIETRPFDSGTDSPIHLTTRTSYGLFETCTHTTYSPSSRERSHAGLKSKTQCRKFPVRGVDCGQRQAPGNSRKSPLTSGATSTVSASSSSLSSLSSRHETELDESFCDRWFLAGYSHQLSLIFSITSILSLALTLVGTVRAGRGYRTERLRQGWKLVVGLMSLQSVTLAVAWSVVAWEFRHERVFNPSNGWGHKSLGSGFVESVTAFGLLVLTITTILFVRVTQKLRIVPQGAARDDGYDEIRE